uniref:Uncharacterized protein n=1 Tax=Rhizophora mucronata TaxID=61149 RepID=A0A2P2J2R0_RHIMU
MSLNPSTNNKSIIRHLPTNADQRKWAKIKTLCSKVNITATPTFSMSRLFV